MTLPTQRIFPILRMILAAAILAACSAACVAQNSDSKKDSDFNLALHANTHVTASDIGLPEYPGAVPYKNPDDKDSDSAVDLGFSFGNVHFLVKAASYITHDSPEQVLAFYRKPLSHYGQVLECDHGHPVGSMKQTPTGLTCNDDPGVTSDSKVIPPAGTNSVPDAPTATASSESIRRRMEPRASGWPTLKCPKIATKIIRPSNSPRL